VNSKEREGLGARILMRICGILVACFGAVWLIPLYAVTVNRLTVSIPLTRDVVVCITVFVLGIATVFLRRWAAVLVSFVALVFSSFAAWACLRGIPFPLSVWVAMFYVAIASMPATCTYFAWRELR
jgi:hypothetical protein